MKLKRSQKNEFFEILEKARLPISLFEYKEQKSKSRTYHGGVKTSILMKDQLFYFSFESNLQSKIKTNCSPGIDAYDEECHFMDYSELADHFQVWAEALKEELETEDKWENFQNVALSLELSQTDNSDNDKFSASEYLEVKSKMEALKHSLDQLQLPPAQIGIIIERLDSLSDQVSVLGKYDWRNLFVGTIISVVLQLSLSQEQGKLLWDLIRRMFSAYFITQ